MKPILEKHKQTTLEQAWELMLRQRKLESGSGMIGYIYEPWSMTIVPKVPGSKRKALTYTPDFLVIYEDHFEIHEVKSAEMAARVGKYREQVNRARMAAERFPWFKWVIVWNEGGAWREEEI